VLPFDLDDIRIEPSKHFRNTKMRKWNWDIHDLREALRDADRVVRRGRNKLEVWTRKGGSKKLVLAHYPSDRLVFVITGTEGRST
jgi:hypothetical protein